jgi:hypothetical protein
VWSFGCTNSWHALRHSGMRHRARNHHWTDNTSSRGNVSISLLRTREAFRAGAIDVLHKQSIAGAVALTTKLTTHGVASATTKKEGEGNVISAAFPFQKKRRRVLGSEMAYVGLAF